MIEFPWKNFKNFIYYGYAQFVSGETLSSKIERIGKGEYPHKFLNQALAADKVPNMMKDMLATFLWLRGQKRLAEVITTFLKTGDPFFLEKCAEEKDKLKQNFFQIWMENKFDAIICPVTPFPAAPLGMGAALTILFPFTIMFNILEMPAGVIPIRKIQKEEMKYESKHKDSKTGLLNKIMEGSEGLPIAIQIAALPFKDEVSLGLMKKVEEIFNFHELQL